MWGPLANGVSFVSNFIGPCLWILIGSLAVGTGLGFTGARIYYRGEIAERKLETAQLREAVATGSAAATRAAREEERQAVEIERAERDRVVLAIADTRAAVLKEIRGTSYVFRQELSDTRWDCLRAPLPEPVLERLRRPAPAAPDD